MNQQTPDELNWHEVLEWAEFCSWATLLMTPMICWLQGPSVSTDQFVVRTALVGIAALSATALRCVAFLRKTSSQSRNPN